MPVTTPTITEGATRTITVNENQTAVGTVNASDLDGDTLRYYIVGGNDKAKFTIDPATGVLTFIGAPDFEAPGDSTKNSAGVINGTNTYDVIVQVEDGTSGALDTLKSTQQRITVVVANVDGVIITGTAGDDTGLGVTGTMATGEADTIYGLGGNDTLNGGIGADIMVGGTGNDTYYVDNVNDATTENANEGTDTVISSITHVLKINVENLTLTGTAAINATGNASDNVLTGNTAANTLDGLAGNDTMYGGVGNDVYKVDSAGDTAIELDGQGTDRVDSSVTFTLGNFVENLTLIGALAINGTGNTLNNTLIGNAAVNTLTGLEGNDTIDGGAGADIMVGGYGDDTYTVDNVGDVVTEILGGGADVVKSSVTYTLGAEVEELVLTGSAALNGTGNALDNVITGNSGVNQLYGMAGNDTLKGGSGIDKMWGGIGSDTYYVDYATETVTENANEGNDTVIASGDGVVLWANVENLILTGSILAGTGNTLDNELTGNTKGNTLTGLAGNDIINGMTGADTMIGGLGNDTYYVDNAADTITENLSEGTDVVKSTVTIGALWANVENVELNGASAINVTGNTLDNVLLGNIAANSLTGLAGNDTLDGGRGYDTLVGGLGNDTYYITDVNKVNNVSNTWDLITENANEGTDTVYSSIQGVTYVLAANVENLVLDGINNIDGTGNALNNVITGNQGWNTLDGAAGNDTISGGYGADVIIGGAGVDTLTGGADTDTFTWKAVTESGTTAGNIDSVTDFNVADIIDLSAIDARASLATDQAFVLDTNGVLTEGEILMTRSGNVITLSIDTDTTAGANMVVYLTVDSSIPSGVLTMDNFIL